MYIFEVRFICETGTKLTIVCQTISEAAVLALYRANEIAGTSFPMWKMDEIYSIQKLTKVDAMGKI